MDADQSTSNSTLVVLPHALAEACFAQSITGYGARCWTSSERATRRLDREPPAFEVAQAAESVPRPAGAAHRRSVSRPKKARAPLHDLALLLELSHLLPRPPQLVDLIAPQAVAKLHTAELMLPDPDPQRLVADARLARDPRRARI